MSGKFVDGEGRGDSAGEEPDDLSLSMGGEATDESRDVSGPDCKAASKEDGCSVEEPPRARVVDPFISGKATCVF